MTTEACAAHAADKPLQAIDIEMIPIQQIDEAYDRIKGDVKYHFVIDSKSLAS